MVSRAFVFVLALTSIFSAFTFADSTNGYAQLVYDPVTNSFTIVGVGTGSGSTTTGQVVSGSSLGNALLGNSTSSTTTSSSAASSTFSVRNITLVYMQGYVDKLRQLTESGFAAVDTKIALTQSKVYGGTGLLQQQELLNCLQYTYGDNDIFNQAEHFKKLKGAIAERSSQVFASIIAHDQKLTVNTISSGSLDDILGRKAIESEIGLFQSSIPILIDAYATNADVLIQKQETTLQSLLLKNKVNVDTYMKRNTLYSAIEAAYNKLFAQVGADQNIAANVEVFNLLADQATSFFLDQYQKYLEDNFLAYVTTDSIGRNALEKEVQTALEATNKKLSAYSREQLNKSYPADTLQDILSAMAKLRAAYTINGQKSCSALLQDNTIETLAPNLQKKLDTMVNSPAEITSKIASGTNRSKIRFGYMDQMQKFYDSAIVGALFDEQVADLTKVVMSYNGVVVKGAKLPTTKSAQTLDLVKRVLVQKYLQYLAKGEADAFAEKTDVALTKLAKMKESDNGTLTSILKLIDEGITYVKDEFLDQK